MPQNRWKVVCRELTFGGDGQTDDGVANQPSGALFARQQQQSSNNKLKMKKNKQQQQEKNQLQPPPKYISQVGLCVGSINFRATVFRRVRACVCLCVCMRETQHMLWTIPDRNIPKKQRIENRVAASFSLVTLDVWRAARSTHFCALTPSDALPYATPTSHSPTHTHIQWQPSLIWFSYG